jgi:F-type H+-transporting ATPase subunit delta
LISSNIAKRYARAFFAIAAEEKLYERFSRELGRFSAILKENKKLSEFLANPVFDQPDKKRSWSRFWKDPVSADRQLSETAGRQARIGILSNIEGSYRELMDNAKGPG